MAWIYAFFVPLIGFKACDFEQYTDWGCKKEGECASCESACLNSSLAVYELFLFDLLSDCFDVGQLGTR